MGKQLARHPIISKTTSVTDRQDEPLFLPQMPLRSCSSLLLQARLFEVATTRCWIDIRKQVLGERLKEIAQITRMGRVTQKRGHSEELLKCA